MHEQLLLDLYMVMMLMIIQSELLCSLPVLFYFIYTRWGPDAALNKSWPGSPRSSACTTPSRDNSFLNVSDVFSPHKRTHQNELSLTSNSKLLTPAENRSTMKQRRITFHSPRDAFQRSYGYEPEEATDWSSALMAKLPTRFLNGKSSVQLERPPDVLTGESTNKPEVKQDESNKETEQEKEDDADDKNTTDFELEQMRRSIYERAFCKQQSYGVQFRKETETTKDKKDDESEQHKEFLTAEDSRNVGTTEKRNMRLSYDKISFPPPLHPGASVMSELSPLSPAWYPSPTETPGRANHRGTPHLPSRFLKAMQTLQQSDIDLPSTINQKLTDNLLSHESAQNSNENSDDKQNVQNNLSTNQNLSHSQNIQDGSSGRRKEVHEEDTRDMQTVDDTGGNIDLEPWELDNKNTRGNIERVLENSDEQVSKAVNTGVEDINKNTTDPQANLENSTGVSINKNMFSTSPSQTQESNNNILEHNLEQDGNYSPGHNLKEVTCHLTKSDHYANEAKDPVPSLAHPYMHDTQSFEVANDIEHSQLPVTEQNYFDGDFKRYPKSESISDVETPRSFIDEETKFQDIFVKSCDQPEPLFEAVNQSDKTTPSKYKLLTSPNQSQSMLETRDNTEVSESALQAEHQSQDETQRTHDSKWSRKDCKTITKALSRDVALYEPELQNEISRDRKVDMIRYVSLERDRNESHDHKGNTQFFNYDVAGVEPKYSRRETRVKVTSQELEELKKELDQGTTGTGNEEHEQNEVKRKNNLVDATSVVTQTLTAMLTDSLKTFQKGRSVDHQKPAHSGKNLRGVLPEVVKRSAEPEPEVNIADEPEEKLPFIGNVEDVVTVHSPNKQSNIRNQEENITATEDRKRERMRKSEDKVYYDCTTFLPDEIM